MDEMIRLGLAYEADGTYDLMAEKEESPKIITFSNRSA